MEDRVSGLKCYDPAMRNLRIRGNKNITLALAGNPYLQ